MVNVQVFTEGKKIDDFDDGYIIAGDGIYLKNSNKWFSHMTKVDSISELPELEDERYLKLRMPKIQFGMLLEAWEFFRKVNEEHSSEAIVILCHDDNVGFYLSVPKQKVSGASLDYDMEEMKNVIGTIHSHNTMSAFHSGTDHSDEQKFDGVHITLGNVDESFPSISCSIMKNGQRFMSKVDQLFDFTDLRHTIDTEKAMELVEKKSSFYDKEKDGVTYYGYDKTRQQKLSGKDDEEDDLWKDYPRGCGGDFDKYSGW